MMRLPLPAGNLAIKAFLQGIAHHGVCQYIQRCKPPLPPQSDLAAHSLFPFTWTKLHMSWSQREPDCHRLRREHLGRVRNVCNTL